jgi:uncharacterized protein YndB with AHSA1/START domain
MKKKLNLEFVVNTSPALIYNRVSSATGLSEWFADDVNSKGNLFTFVWDKQEQVAKIVDSKKNEYIRFSWIDEEDETEKQEEDQYFEFKIQNNELTGDVSLLITDFSEEEELDQDRELWEQQIYQLKHVLGL